MMRHIMTSGVVSLQPARECHTLVLRRLAAASAAAPFAPTAPATAGTPGAPGAPGTPGAPGASAPLGAPPPHVAGVVHCLEHVSVQTQVDVRVERRVVAAHEGAAPTTTCDAG